MGTGLYYDEQGRRKKQPNMVTALGLDRGAYKAPQQGNVFEIPKDFISNVAEGWKSMLNAPKGGLRRQPVSPPVQSAGATAGEGARPGMPSGQNPSISRPDTDTEPSNMALKEASINRQLGFAAPPEETMAQAPDGTYYNTGMAGGSPAAGNAEGVRYDTGVSDPYMPEKPAEFNPSGNIMRSMDHFTKMMDESSYDVGSNFKSRRKEGKMKALLAKEGLDMTKAMLAAEANTYKGPEMYQAELRDVTRPQITNAPDMARVGVDASKAPSEIAKNIADADEARQRGLYYGAQAAGQPQNQEEAMARILGANPPPADTRLNAGDLLKTAYDMNELGQPVINAERYEAIAGSDIGKKFGIPSFRTGTGGSTTTGIQRLDNTTASALLKEAGGDKEKARELARVRGYQF
jgi:hypothetical protein